MGTAVDTLPRTWSSFVVMDGIEQMDQVLATATRQDGVIAAWQCLELGMEPAEIKRLCRSGSWERLHHGVYLVDARIVGSPGSRGMVRAASLSAGPHSVAVLETAAAIHGIGGVPNSPGTGGLPRSGGAVHLSLPGIHSRPRRTADCGLVFHQFVQAPDQIVTVDGIKVTSPLQTVADLILRLDRYSAVCVMDSALNRGLVSEAEFATLPDLIAGRRGAAKARLWIPEADARAQSPLETRVRLRCVDGKVAPDVLQHKVYTDDGHLLGVGDLAWLAARVLGEADGAEVHDRPEAIFRDRWRQNELANAGWIIIRFTWADTLRQGYIVYVVRGALARAVAA
jgi:hypothetical protein